MAPTSGSTFYIQNQAAGAQSAGFWVNQASRIDARLSMNGPLRLHGFYGMTGYPGTPQAGDLYYNNAPGDGFMGYVQDKWLKFVTVDPAVGAAWVSIQARTPTTSQVGGLWVDGQVIGGQKATFVGVEGNNQFGDLPAPGGWLPQVFARSTQAVGKDVGGSIGFYGLATQNSVTSSVNFGVISGRAENAPGSRAGYLGFYTYTGSALPERMRITASGMVRIVALKTSGTAPTNNGTAYMVTTDLDGQLSFQPIPTGTFTTSSATGGVRTAASYNANNINVTLTAADHFVNVDATSADAIINLPANPETFGGSVEYTITKMDAGTNTVWINAASGHTIEGVTQKSLTARYKKITVAWAGSGTWIVTYSN
jgi:hypothetical protein